MKLSDILLVVLFLVMGSLIFAMKKMQAEAEAKGDSIQTPAPTLKPESSPLSEANTPQLRGEISTPEMAGSYGRLSLEELLARDANNIDNTPKTKTKSAPQSGGVIKRPRKNSGDQARLETPPLLNFPAHEFETAQTVKLAALPDINDVHFMDQVVNMAEASPIQPESRGCGTLKNSLQAAPKYAKVRSVGMERQISESTSIGVEYVYKDGCYKNAIAPLQAHDMPGDDGVNLHVNMRF